MYFVHIYLSVWEIKRGGMLRLKIGNETYLLTERKTCEGSARTTHAYVQHRLYRTTRNHSLYRATRKH